jgi:hypothetical protein
MPSRLSYLLLLALFVVPSLSAQEDPTEKDTTAVNPPDLSFSLATKGGQAIFHLGEIIEIQERYSSNIPSKYYLAAQPSNIEGGFSTKITILPKEPVIDRLQNTGRVSAEPILTANCTGYGLLGGSGGACGDCEGRWVLGREPLRFPYALNYRFTITEPGSYKLMAHAGNIVLSGAPSNEERALEVTSNSIEIDVVRDEVWSSDQLRLAVGRFEVAQRSYLLERWDERSQSLDHPEETVRRTGIGKEMNDAAQVIRFLDTEESLGQAVRLYDGSTNLAGYENPFWKAILESSHRKLAVKLLADRMLMEDFIVSQDLLDVLTAMSIQQEEPEAFERGEVSSRKQLSFRTRGILKDYVLSLGKSLPSKNAKAREVGIKTFEHYAGQSYCTGGPLIEDDQAKEILKHAYRVDP